MVKKVRIGSNQCSRYDVRQRRPSRFLVHLLQHLVQQLQIHWLPPSRPALRPRLLLHTVLHQLRYGQHRPQTAGQRGSARANQRRISSSIYSGYDYGAMIGLAPSSESFGSTPIKLVPCSNQLRGAAAPHSVCRCGSLRSHFIGSRSGSTV